MSEIRCMFCGKFHLESLKGQAVWTCPRCGIRNCVERLLTECDILYTGLVGAKYRETGEQRNDTRLGSAVKQ